MEEPSGRVAPPLPSSGGGGSGRRMRRPLSDCTNTARTSSQPSSSPSASVLKPQMKPDFSIPQSNSHFSRQNSRITARGPSSGPVAPASDIPCLPPLKSSSTSGRDQSETLDSYTVETQGQVAQKAKTKSKAVMAPTKRIRVSRDRLDQDKDDLESKSCLIPKKRKQYSKREQDNSKKALEDYIQQQRSYYAEIDAFELPEEEVDSTAALD